jgi:hypothetical protein
VLKEKDKCSFGKAFLLNGNVLYVNISMTKRKRGRLLEIYLMIGYVPPVV